MSDEKFLVKVSDGRYFAKQFRHAVQMSFVPHQAAQMSYGCAALVAERMQGMVCLADGSPADARSFNHRDACREFLAVCLLDVPASAVFQ